MSCQVVAGCQRYWGGGCSGYTACKIHQSFRKSVVLLWIVWLKKVANSYCNFTSEGFPLKANDKGQPVNGWQNPQVELRDFFNATGVGAKFHCHLAGAIDVGSV